MRYAWFDNQIYSDAGLTQEIVQPVRVVSSTKLPSAYYSNSVYTKTVRNGESVDDKVLYTCTFTYPSDVTESSGVKIINENDGSWL